MYLPWNASRARMREAENARRNRAEILQAWSQGRLSRRDLMKLGLFTAAGTLVLKNGLSPFARSAYADDSSIPTGLPRSPLFAGLGAESGADGPGQHHAAGSEPRVGGRETR